MSFLAAIFIKDRTILKQRFSFSEKHLLVPVAAKKTTLWAIAIFFFAGDFGRARKALRESLQLAEENDDIHTKELAESSIMKLDVNTS